MKFTHNKVIEHSYSEGTLSKSRVATVSAGPDNGANNCIAAAFPEPGRHSTTNQALSNLVSGLGFVAEKDEDNALGLREPFICGHGNEGSFETGSGQGNRDTNTQLVLTWNQSSWQPEFERLRGRSFAILSIISCHTGAGEDGADLLHAIAQIVGRPVRGRTGFTYCGGANITFEANSTWQTATPETRPAPIAAPTPHFGTLEESVSMLIRDENGYKEIPLQSIQSVVVSRAPQFSHNQAGQVSLDSNSGKDLLRLVDFNHPFYPGGVPTAFVTGLLSLTYIDSESSQATKDFVIYNDRLIQDKEFSDAYYYVAPSFKAFIQSL